MTTAEPADRTTGPGTRLGAAPAVRFFDLSARDYETKHYQDAIRSFMTVRQERVLELVDGLKLRPGSRVLDAGCGPGYLLEALASRGFEVCGLDAATGMLKSARSRLARSGPRLAATFKRASIEHLPYRDESFDLVCSTGVIEYLETDGIALAEMARVLRPRAARSVVVVTGTCRMRRSAPCPSG